MIVKPEKVSDLEIVDGADYCTLVTCTPYGINTHRLLVRGHRIETEEAATAIRIMADAIRVDELIVAPVIACPLLFLILFAMFIETQVNRHRFGDESNRLEESDETLELMIEEMPRRKKRKTDKNDGKKADDDADTDHPV